MEISPLDGAFGVEVSGIDRAENIDAAAVETLRNLLLKNRLLVFRDQKLDAPALRDLGGPSGTRTANVDAAKGCVGHPMVRTIPETGEKALYVNLAFAVGIKGREKQESRPLLNKLIQHAVDDAFVTRLKWKPGTLAIRDNRSTQHNALNDYAGHRREMLRVVIEGDRPV